MYVKMGVVRNSRLYRHLTNKDVDGNNKSWDFFVRRRVTALNPYCGNKNVYCLGSIVSGRSKERTVI